MLFIGSAMNLHDQRIFPGGIKRDGLGNKSIDHDSVFACKTDPFRWGNLNAVHNFLIDVSDLTFAILVDNENVTGKVPSNTNHRSKVMIEVVAVHIILGAH